MNKNELIASVARSAGLSKADACKVIDGVFDSIGSTLAGGGEVRLIGFGTFGVMHRAASMGRHPRTGERISIAASKRPRFRAGKALKNAVRGGEDRADPAAAPPWREWDQPISDTG